VTIGCGDSEILTQTQGIEPVIQLAREFEGSFGSRNSTMQTKHAITDQASETASIDRRLREFAIPTDAGSNVEDCGSL
jgi:hypothetical protein